MFYRANLDLSFFGDVQFLRLNLQAQKFIPMIYNTTLGLNGEIGWGLGLGSRPYPVFKNFYGGGLGSVRVFQQGSLGIVDPTGSFIGGTRKANANVQLYFPLPGTGTGQELAAVRVHRRGQRLGRKTSRSPATACARRSGVGCQLDVAGRARLTLSYGTPIKSQPTDRIQPFQFQIGTRF